MSATHAAALPAPWKWQPRAWFGRHRLRRLSRRIMPAATAPAAEAAITFRVGSPPPGEPPAVREAYDALIRRHPYGGTT
ncbi:hypothetical protein J5X84_36365 [Streptosporangiaceae bacterium NEAU-GS5]|nr:hypothetical protein [Streptosporangiaceae bacterium NEAU-GS5]